KMAQEFSVRLFFSDILKEQYSQDPRRTLERYGLEDKWKDLLPDVHSEAFEAEAYGRRILIARELYHRFPKTFAQLLNVEQANPIQVMHSIFFKDFIQSQFFFLPDFSSPHPYGIGCGYESMSKFFFWLRDENSKETLHEESSKELKYRFYTEFGLYLLQMIPHAKDSYFDLFHKGICFIIGSTETCLISPRPEIRRVSALLVDRLTKEKLFFDLDQLIAGPLNKQTITMNQSDRSTAVAW
ncbi:MAG: hypothetical protein ACO3LE_10150, partial [Bdellovibrionota bacterium]